MIAVHIKVVLLILCLVTFIATPLVREEFVLAEELPKEINEVQDVIDADSNEVSSDATKEMANAESATSSSGEAPKVASKPWYKIERISGQLQMGDFVVGPGKAEVELAPGQEAVLEITITNRISDNRLFRLEVEDMVGSADGSSALTLTGDKEGPYSLRNFISFPEDTIELKLGERARVPVTITIPPNTSPGGYYGSVLVSTVRKPGEDTGQVANSGTPLIARVGSLFFITVKGEAHHEGRILEVQTLDDKWWYESGPVQLGILSENTGSVHLNHYGSLTITNMFGEEVASLELDPWFILPQSLRLREFSWDREFLLGRYTVTATVNRGYDDIVDEVSVSFWVLPWKIVGGILVVLFIVIFSLRAFFRTFEFKRKGP